MIFFIKLKEDQKMSRGGYRVGSGRPKGAKSKSKKDVEIGVKNGVQENLTPLEYMLKIMNDPGQDIERRMKMAISAAPYVHPRATEKGKKEVAEERAKKANKGRFAPGRAPLTRIK
jgi:phage terminase small subunit